MKNYSIHSTVTTWDSQHLDSFLNEIGKIALLSADEEEALFYAYHAGDQSALQRIISANLRFVVTVAKQYQNNGVLLCDLINEGNIGLIKAVQKFDVKK